MLCVLKKVGMVVIVNRVNDFVPTHDWYMDLFIYVVVGLIEACLEVTSRFSKVS